MRTIPAGFHDGIVTDLHICWKLVRRDGEIILGTECDRNIEITTAALAGVYRAHAAITGSDIRSNSDMSVDNLEVRGALIDSTTGDTSETSSTSDLTLLDLSAADIEAGMFDNAECTTFLVNSSNPDLYQHIQRTGWLGNVQRTAEGEYTTELRGLTQALSQGIVRTYSIGCDAELGDSRCKVDMTAFTFPRTVTAVTSRRVFSIDSPFGVLGHMIPGGKVAWNSGLNEGRVMEIKEYSALQITLYLPMPEDIDVGDTLNVLTGCNKSQSMCIDDYDNILNRRAHAVFVPGMTEVLKVGKRR